LAKSPVAERSRLCLGKFLTLGIHNMLTVMIATSMLLHVSLTRPSRHSCTGIDDAIGLAQHNGAQTNEIDGGRTFSSKRALQSGKRHQGGRRLTLTANYLQAQCFGNF
jgi:hypothetical protein